jgi:hypothetical protein
METQPEKLEGTRHLYVSTGTPKIELLIMAGLARSPNYIPGEMPTGQPPEKVELGEKKSCPRVGEAQLVAIYETIVLRGSRDEAIRIGFLGPPVS